MGKMELFILNGTKGHDVAPLVQSLVWSGKKGAAARSIEVTMLDDDAKGQPRVTMNLEEGYTCIFKWNGEELFRGIIMKQTLSQKKMNKWKAYDICIYLANSKDSFSYDNKTLTQIFNDCIKRAGLSAGSVAKTSHVIPSLKKSKSYFADCLFDAMSTQYSSTGNRYYFRANKNNVDLLLRKEQSTQWVLEIGANIISYSYTQSIEKVKTRFRIYSKEGSVVYEKSNAELEKKLGSIIMIDSVDDDYNDAQIKELVNTMLKENGYPERSLNVEALGIVSAIAGGCLYVKIPHLNISRTFYIDADSHKFSGEKHTMSLTLNFAKDIASAG